MGRVHTLRNPLLLSAAVSVAVVVAIKLAAHWLGWEMIATTKSEVDRKAMSFAMNLSLGIGLLMFVMKVGAYLLTGSAVRPHLRHHHGL